MTQNTTMNNVAANNNMIIAMSKEEVEMKTKDQIRAMLETVGVEMSNNVFKNTKKAELVAMVEQYLDPSKKVEIVEVGDTTPVTEETKEESTMEKKEWKDMTLEEKKADALLAKWDKLVKAAAKEYTFQSLYKDYANAAAGKDMGKRWKLFYDNTKSTVTNDDYCVLQSRLFAATGRAITFTYGSKHNNEDHIRQLLNVMIFRGYLNYTKVDGKNGKKNTIVSAMKKQMNDMFALTK